jgi:hypothetical protein
MSDDDVVPRALPSAILVQAFGLCDGASLEYNGVWDRLCNAGNDGGRVCGYGEELNG